MKPPRINLVFGIILLAVGLEFGIWRFDSRNILPSLIFLVINLLPGTVQLSFYRHYSLHPRNPGDWQIWVPVMALLMMIFLFDMVAWGFDRSTNHKYDHISLSEVSRVTHVEFPPSSRLLNSTGQAFMHTLLWVKVEMRPLDIESFLKTLNKSHPIDISRTKRLPNWAGGSPGRLKKGRFDWWQTDSVRHFICAKTAVPEGSGGTEIWLLIDQDQPGRAVVYLNYFRD